MAVITEILASVRRLLDSVLRLNDTGLVRPSAESCSLGEVLRTLRRELDPVARRKGLNLCFDDTAEQLRTDPVLLRELLQNLVSNAIRYTHQGQISVSCRRNDIAAHIEIADTGVGMSDDHLERIFASRAAEAAAGSERRSGGFGLGLVIVKRLADVLGYRVEARSRLGHGSVFTVKIPLMGRFEPLLSNGDYAASASEPHLTSNGD
ncbi:MAG TPA: ATP-binding protein [Gammaproteobacteria bacterium]|nr:ATP-binding protein [Gammaproteobacteria bacterium]